MVVVVVGAVGPGFFPLGHIPAGRHGRADWGQPDERPDADLIGPDIRGRASGVDFCSILNKNIFVDFVY